MEDGQGHEIEIGDIVAVQFHVTAFDGEGNQGVLILEPIVGEQSGFPGRVAIASKDVVFIDHAATE